MPGMNLLTHTAFGRLTVLMIASPVILLLLGSALSENAEAHAHHNAAYASIAALKGRLGLPKNFQVEDVRVTDAGAACIRYSARNELGAIDRAQAVVVGSEVTQTDTPE